MSADISIHSLPRLVNNYSGGIRIPMIQRDYAQGRMSWANPRKRLLDDIRKALLPEGDPLHLDFVYGIQQEEDGIPAFYPLDGQQRLTTLFLLHWYLAIRDGCFGEFQTTFRATAQTFKFTYQVRPGGRSFFQCLVTHAPEREMIENVELSSWIREQSWFRSIWERDPSVAGALVMLDAIHHRFKDAPTCSYEQLVNGGRITFQVLDLEATGLHDDLYLRMNARGRPLTQFETFKARFEKHLERTFPDSEALERCTVKSVKDFSSRIDKEWLDFMWCRYGPKESCSEETGTMDVAFMNLFRAIALVSLPRSGKDEDNDDPAVTSLSDGLPDYDDFENGGWLTTTFTTHLIHLLESCTKGVAEQKHPLFEPPWFEEGNLLDNILLRERKPTLTDYLQFAACVRFIAKFGPKLEERTMERFQSWMRLVRNLVLNSDVRASSFPRMLAGLNQLVNGTVDTLAFLTDARLEIPGFNKQQMVEERLKASLMLADVRWAPLIVEAEDHGYFRGQIGFLLEFSRASDTSPGCESLETFKIYLDRAKQMFNQDGLHAMPDFLWERALLAVGDYFLPVGGCRWSFLVYSQSDRGSWKRLLGAGDQDNVAKSRRLYLQILWDRMGSESPAQIASVPIQEAWRQALCDTPQAWAYCQKRQIRFEEREGLPPRVFLLSATRRSAAYAELFTFRLRTKADLANQRNAFAPLVFDKAEDQTGSDDQPHLAFGCAIMEDVLHFHLYCQFGSDHGFSLWISTQKASPDLIKPLQKAGFTEENGQLVKRQIPGNPLEGQVFLKQVADALTLIQHPS